MQSLLVRRLRGWLYQWHWVRRAEASDALLQMESGWHKVSRGGIFGFGDAYESFSQYIVPARAPDRGATSTVQLLGSVRKSGYGAVSVS